MKLSDFDYHLPPERIAQQPLEERDASRLLVVDRSSGALEDRLFTDLPALLNGNELLVVNDTRVLPARLYGRRRGRRSAPPARRGRARREHLQTPIEVLLVRALEEDVWEALVRPGRKIRTGERIVFSAEHSADSEPLLEAEVVGRGERGLRRLRLISAAPLRQALERLGHVPLPPYIRRADTPADRERYQTIFAAREGAVAAPTAALHFTPRVVAALAARGAELCAITLHTGLGTFQPIRAENIEEHRMHPEAYEISAEAAARIQAARQAGRAVVAVGTTVVRALEDAAWRARAAGSPACVLPGRAEAEVFIRPGHTFRVVDHMLTNFHLPRSTLLVLVAAFAGRERVLAAYRHAVAAGYRFYSYGDAMLIR